MENIQQGDIEIKVTIGLTQLKSEFGGAAKNLLYPVTGSNKNGQFSTKRKYADFQALRGVLVDKWPGFFIPSLPEKKNALASQIVALQIRRKGLEQFLRLLSQIQYIWNSQELQIFLRIAPQDCQKSLLKLKQIHLTNILAKYESIFPQFFNQEVSQQIKSKIIQFGQFLKKSNGLLQNLQKTIVQMQNSNRKATEKYYNIIQNILPQYEKNCVSTYKNPNAQNKNMITDLNAQNNQNLIQLKKYIEKNSMVEILVSLKREKAQIQSFQQILKVREYFSILKNKATSKVKDLQIDGSKLNAGKESFFSKLTKKTKQEQLKQNQINIQKALQQQKNLTLLYQVITAIIGYVEIDKFKRIREKQYFKLVKRFCHLQIEQNKLIKQHWMQIAKNVHNQLNVSNLSQNNKKLEYNNSSQQKSMLIQKDNYYSNKSENVQQNHQQKQEKYSEKEHFEHKQQEIQNENQHSQDLKSQTEEN